MGGKCCTDGRSGKDAAGGNKERKSMYDRKSVYTGNAYGKKKGLSIGAANKGDDAEKFDKAFESGDLKTFVALLSSKQPIDKFEEKMHPWAEDPRTVGALAGTQLAIMASSDEDNPNIKNDIRNAGGIPPLVEFVKSDEVDRVQTAVVALSFLTAECPANGIAVYEAGVMEVLLKHLDSPVAGMRAAAATTLRNMCMEKEEYRNEFANKGGIEGFVKQLEIQHDPSLHIQDVQLEALLNLQDILESDDGSVNPDHAKKAKAAGAVQKLNKLLNFEDEEVRTCAEEVMAALEEAT